VKELAQAISALINSTPRTPWVEEIEAVIRKHMPEAPDSAVSRFDTSFLGDALCAALHPRRKRVPVLCYPDVDLTANVPKGAICLYSAHLLLIDPRDDERGLNGKLINPPCFYACWHNEEMDRIDAGYVPWGAAHVLVPASYDRILKAWKLLKDASP
jgi:hypothetical protein